MQTNRRKWLAYTVLVGLIPIVTRILVWLITKQGSIAAFSPQDFITFGLVLHISNINEIEHLVDRGSSWVSTQNGVSAFFIAIHGALFCVTLIGNEAIDERAIMYCVAGTALASLSISYTLFNRISKSNATTKECSV